MRAIKCNFKTYFLNSKSISFVEIEPKLLTYMHIKSRVWFYIRNRLCAKIAFTNKLLQRLLRKVNEHFKSDTSSIAEENTLLIWVETEVLHCIPKENCEWNIWESFCILQFSNKYKHQFASRLFTCSMHHNISFWFTVYLHSYIPLALKRTRKRNKRERE